MNRITRRQVLRLFSSAGGAAVLSCTHGRVIEDKPPMITRPRADVYLDGGESTVASEVMQLIDKLVDLVMNRDPELRIAFLADGWEVLKLSIEEGRADTWRLVRERTHEVSHIGLSQRFGLPTFKLTDDQGRLILVQDRTLEAPFKQLPTSLSKLLEIGAVVAAAVLALWLALKIARFVLTVIGFLIFAALVIGALLLAAGLSASVLRPLLHTIGIGMADIRSFFTQSLGQFRKFLARVQSQQGP